MRNTRHIALVGALLLLACMALAAAITVKVNGNTVRVNEAPFTRHETKFVEIEPVCKAADAEFKWDKQAGRITICRKGTCTSFKVGDGPKDAYVKNERPCADHAELARKLGGSSSYDSTAQVISFTIN